MTSDKSYGRKGLLLIHSQTDDTTNYYHEDWIGFEAAGGHKGNEEQEAAGDELVFVGNGITEILNIHQQQSSCCQQTDYGWAKAFEHAFDQWMMLVLEEELANGEHQDE